MVVVAMVALKRVCQKGSWLVCNEYELSLVWLILRMVECIPQHLGTNVPKEGKVVSCGSLLPRGRGCTKDFG